VVRGCRLYATFLFRDGWNVPSLTATYSPLSTIPSVIRRILTRSELGGDLRLAEASPISVIEGHSHALERID